jgi:hypothetical protein
MSESLHWDAAKPSADCLSWLSRGASCSILGVQVHCLIESDMFHWCSPLGEHVHMHA